MSGEDRHIQHERLNYALELAAKKGLTAGAYGFIGATTVSVLASKFSPIFRSVTLPGKVFLVATVTFGTGVIAAEQAIYQVNRPYVSTESTVKAVNRYDLLLEHRYEIVGGIYAASVLGGILMLGGNPNKNISQKFMDIRLFAQAIGLVSLLGAVGLASVAVQRRK